ncbi:hypothetical protein [Actinoplanes sp. DH11]|uniref:hypothetical protein n=1 Tax=Actinoplanes sp. DH11 TaxID=2857011 RepID=UPI001E4875C3|nr:hypothetical protein [Actinoplanes sp. DH11]
MTPPVPAVLVAASDIYLKVGADTVEVRCETHEEFTYVQTVDADRQIPVSPLFEALCSHSVKHRPSVRRRAVDERQDLWLPATYLLAGAG